MSDKTIHYVYEITNKINGKKYIGKHSTNNLDDGYLGSGKLISAAIKKYGSESFDKNILMYFCTEELALEYEKFLITDYMIESDQYYNLVYGGLGFNKGQIGACKNTFWINNGKSQKRIHKGKSIPDGWTKGKLNSGTENTQWINNGIDSKLIKLSDKIPKNWTKGHLHHNKFENYIWINNGKKSKRILKSSQIPDGWKQGFYVKPATTGTKWINNGIVNKLIKPNEIIPNGWVKGRLTSRDKEGKFSKAE